jgi:hypothetical protein
MKRAGRVAICVACLASIWSVAAASAAPIREPNQGRCRFVAGPSEFEEGNCNKTGVTNEFQWCWTNGWTPSCSGGAGNWRWELGQFVLESTSLAKFTCTSAKAGGVTIIEPGPVTELATLSSCTSSGFSCQSAGASKGEIKTNALDGTYGYISAAKHTVGLQLSSPSSTLAEFSCGNIPVVLRGAVVGHVPANKAVAKLALVFNEKAGKQSVAGLEGAKTQLEVSVSGGPYQHGNAYDGSLLAGN